MTRICDYIKDQEIKVWLYLSRVFSYQLRASELGFTNDLVFKIIDFYEHSYGKCEVLTKHSDDEVKRGADIELCIFNGVDFDCFLIQSKIMKFNGIYTDIRKFDPQNRQDNQYQKLIRTAKDEDKFPLYLLYNGDSINSCHGWHCANSRYTHSFKLGYTIIGAKTIRKNRVKKFYQNPARDSRIRNKDICCEMNPLHYLFCPGFKTGYDLPPGKTYQEIYKDYPYRKVFGSINPRRNSNVNNLQNDSNRTDNTRKPRFAAACKIIIDDPDIYG